MSLFDSVREYRKLASRERRSRLRCDGGFSGSYVNEGIAVMARARHEDARAARRKLWRALEADFAAAHARELLGLLFDERDLLNAIYESGHEKTVEQHIALLGLRRVIREWVKKREAPWVKP